MASAPYNGPIGIDSFFSPYNKKVCTWFPLKSSLYKNRNASMNKGQKIMSESHTMHGTTILSVSKGNSVVLAGDGQVTLGHVMLKTNAKKVRRLGNGDIIAGFAGATADALTLFERLEQKLEQYPKQLMRACVELAKDWRTDRYLRRLEAMMAVVDKNVSLILTGNGDVLEPEDGLIGIGSGGSYALASARALYPNKDLSAKEIVERSMEIAAGICIYTNHAITVEELK